MCSGGCHCKTTNLLDTVTALKFLGAGKAPWSFGFDASPENEEGLIGAREEDFSELMRSGISWPLKGN